MSFAALLTPLLSQVGSGLVSNLFNQGQQAVSRVADSGAAAVQRQLAQMQASVQSQLAQFEQSQKMEKLVQTVMDQRAKGQAAQPVIRIYDKPRPDGSADVRVGYTTKGESGDSALIKIAVVSAVLMGGLLLVQSRSK